ncbi:metallophosphoesterase family protein [Mesoterricola sediminis]|uniref:Calcineurin-like phosphoesterase domain-containing protein n=1 Tax=Mesoterricola sediminis TaxID=2927980 RepID=A0AA48KGT6_9BACT|nr:hypothetical protein [Mesoterricola sediminis]BDU77723.1 hypothetical protein METESE_26810 [Mesoterricola sediminis]
MALPLAVIVSDVHLGDPSGVVSPFPRSGYADLGGVRVRRDWLDWMAQVDARLAAEGAGARIPHLVINGDFWDVSIRNMDEVAALSLAFFDAAEVERRFEQILFLPGNHDHVLWSWVQMQTTVIRPLEKLKGAPAVPGGSVVFPMPHAACAVLDLRGATPAFAIQGVQGPYTGDVFVSGLTRGRIPVNVAYPALHVLRGDGTALLVTHGHFFQLAWTLLSEVLGPALDPPLPGGLDFYYLELLNASLTDFLNFALGQVGPLSGTLQRMYDQIRAGHEPPEVKRIMDAIRDLMDRALDFKAEPRWKAGLQEWGSDRLLDFQLYLLKRVVGLALRRSEAGWVMPTVRGEGAFLEDPRNAARLDAFMACAAKDDSLRGFRVDDLVFGHTHQSLAGRPLTLPSGRRLRCWNTGSLVCAGEGCDFQPVTLDRAGRVAAMAPAP